MFLSLAVPVGVGAGCSEGALPAFVCINPLHLCKCTQKKEISRLFVLSLCAKSRSGFSLGKGTALGLLFNNCCVRMDKLASLWAAIRKSKYLNKYVVTLALFIVIVGFLDENSIIRRVGYAHEESLLREEIGRYQSEYDESTRRLNELAVDSGAIERIAREKYLMKRPNEDIFVFEGGAQ